MKILLEKTDENNLMSASDLIAELNNYGIKAERKTIYSDIDLLKQFGLDIEKVQSKTFGYRILSREFELAELKLLVDAVQSSRFITHKKSDALIKKIFSLTSRQQAKQLNRYVHIHDRPKTINENIYYNVDTIHEAINTGKKVSFKYFDYDTSKKKVYRKNGGTYCQTPLSLCWNEDSYYLISYSVHHDDLVHYRVDRISDVTICDENADTIDAKRFDIAEHSKKFFGMYNGELIRATLSFDNRLVNVVLDRFGKDVIIANGGDRFDITVEISDSPVFLAWMFQFGEQAEIKAPEKLKNSMRSLIEKNRTMYK